MADRAKSSTKRCTKCGSGGPFYKNKNTQDGFHAWCKECVKKGQKLHYGRHPGLRTRETQRWAKANPEQVKAKQNRWYQKNPERAREFHCKAQLRYGVKNPAKLKARAAVRQAVLRGELTVGPCSRCGLPPSAACGRQAIEGHHHAGYEKAHWLDVTWLCAKCHGQEESKA